MAGSYSGDFADAKLIHPLDTEDGDTVGGGAYTLKGGATIQGTSKFGSALLCEMTLESLDSDGAVPGIDQSDTAKTITHIFARVDGSLTVARAFCFLGNSTLLAAKLFYFYASGRNIVLRWNRATTLGAGPRMQVTSLVDQFTTGSFFSIVGFIDANSETQGKIFKDGVDITLSTGASAGVAAATSGFDFLRIGNQVGGGAFGRFLDHLTIIQSSSLNDTKAASLATNYHDTRGFGYRPTFTSTSTFDVAPGDTVTLAGEGFGLDVTIKVGGIASPSVVRISESSITFEVPEGISQGDLNLEINNVAANVAFTEVAALRFTGTRWVPGGLSDRVTKVGDGMLIGSGFLIGSATPFCDPNLDCTPWTRTGLEP